VTTASAETLPFMGKGHSPPTSGAAWATMRNEHRASNKRGGY
jgi:hypothetical protein